LFAISHGEGFCPGVGRAFLPAKARKRILAVAAPPLCVAQAAVGNLRGHHRDAACHAPRGLDNISEPTLCRYIKGLDGRAVAGVTLYVKMEVFNQWLRFPRASRGKALHAPEAPWRHESGTVYSSEK